MLFMVSTRPKAGATREQLIEHLTRRISPATWDLIRDGVLSHVLYKVGDEPGFFAILNAPSGEEAKTMGSVSDSISVNSQSRRHFHWTP